MREGGRCAGTGAIHRNAAPTSWHPAESTFESPVAGAREFCGAPAGVRFPPLGVTGD